MNTELKRLAAAVLEMRNAQRAYFADRSQTNLRDAKAAEQHVDECLAWIASAGQAIDAADIRPVRRPPAQQKTFTE